MGIDTGSDNLPGMSLTKVFVISCTFITRFGVNRELFHSKDKRQFYGRI